MLQNNKSVKRGALPAFVLFILCTAVSSQIVAAKVDSLPLSLSVSSLAKKDNDNGLRLSSVSIGKTIESQKGLSRLLGNGLSTSSTQSIAKLKNTPTITSMTANYKKGKTLKFTGPFGVESTSDGRILVGWYNGPKIIETMKPAEALVFFVGGTTKMNMNRFKVPKIPSRSVPKFKDFGTEFSREFTSRKAAEELLTTRNTAHLKARELSFKNSVVSQKPKLQKASDIMESIWKVRTNPINTWDPTPF